MVPGPVPDFVPSDVARPSWFFPRSPDFCLGTGNPSGINNKLHVLESFPIGWWHLAETQASKFQQCCFQQKLRSISFSQDRHIRSVLGAPAPLRAGSSYAGSWTGVLSFGDCPLREVPGIWPHGEFTNGRVSLSTAYLFGLEITAATVYLPPRGPTFPQARHMSELLLTRVTEEIVFGRQGPRVILGDFNCEAGSLDSMKLWVEQGFVEAQAWFSHTYGFSPRHTCKGATAPDQIWVSQELLPFISNIGTWPIFPDHDVLAVGLSLPMSGPSFEMQWPLPGRIQWESVDPNLWASQVPLISIQDRFNSFQDGVPATQKKHLEKKHVSDAFAQWSADFEQQVAECFRSDVVSQDSSFRGRGQLTKPKSRRLQPVVPKHARPGEVAQASGFLNRSTNRWYQQVRRLQSYKHAVLSARAAETFLSRAALWQSIRRASGFVHGFVAWWESRPTKLQGSPVRIPDYPPDATVAVAIYEDFLANYRRYEHWQHSKRRASTAAKVASSSKTIFALTRKPPKASLDCLEDKYSQQITVIDTQANIVAVAEDFPIQSVHRWTLQGQPALVKAVPQGYKIDCDLILCSGQELACFVTVSDISQIHIRLEKLWSPIWNRHKDVPPDRWKEIVDFGLGFLPQGTFNLPAVTSQDWHKAIHKFKLHAAAGPCGFTRSDVHHFQSHHVEQILELYQLVEKGTPWPHQCSTGLIHCLQKKSDRFSVEGFRPITVTSMLFRVYAGIRAGQLLYQLSQVTGHFQCGFARGRKSADVWFFVNICVELALQSQTPVHGFVADLTKAYNYLPRHPVFRVLQHCGVPRWFLSMWENYLLDFDRRFVVRKGVSSSISSVTGFPEGCPLSCVAMSCIDWLWHIWQSTRIPKALPISYVDNLESIAQDTSELFGSWNSLLSFCHSLDLVLDYGQSYAWSTSPVGRSELRSLGFKISYGDRDLGGQVCYSAQLRNKVLVDRINAVAPFFDTLRRSSQTTSIKLANIVQVLWPRALHGCEAVELGRQHYVSLRSGAMRALRCNRAGASPLVRIALLKTETLDPAWYDLWHTICTFKQQCLHCGLVFDWWSKYAASQVYTHGPFGKLWSWMQELNLTLDGQFRLWFSEQGWIHVLWSPERELKDILLRAFRAQKATELNKRPGFASLNGFDFSLTTQGDSSLSLKEVELLNIVRDGSFITNSYKGRFDVKKSTLCQYCDTLDTRRHRLEECSHYHSIRQQHGELFQVWHDLPECLQLHGLLGENPWKELVWEALIALPSRISDFSCSPRGNIKNVFTDGTCSNPDCKEESLAAWAAIWTEEAVVISSGWVTGLTQSIMRAEITAIYSTLLWNAQAEGEIHLWIDNENVVAHVRALQQGLASPADFEHADLWWKIDDLLRYSLADVYAHKVSSHIADEHCFSPFDDWCKCWNDFADAAAARANSERPTWFTRLWNHYMQHRRHWSHLKSLVSKFHLAVAQHDCQTQEAIESSEQEVSTAVEFEWYENDLSFSTQLSSSVGEELVFQQCTSLYKELVKWLIDVDQGASRVRLVTHLEIYIAFRLSCGKDRTIRQLSEVDSVFTEATLAADYSYFKKHLLFPVLRTVLGAISEGHLDLSGVGIHFPVPAFYFGWPSDLEVQSLSELRGFVGRRPVTSSQALSRPWR